MKHGLPRLSAAQIPATVVARVTDESGNERKTNIAGERPLTLYVDKREIITLMTLGQMPEALTIGWLRNQQMIESLDDVEEVIVDWEVDAAAVRTRHGLTTTAAEERKTITSGCGQGSMFSRLLENVEAVQFNRSPRLSVAVLQDLLRQIRERDTVYKAAGAVHGCALATHDGKTARILAFVEDIGRHNAVDTIAGWMWLNNISSDGKVFYTTGRLTSEMVIKCAQMRVPYLASRSGTTQMGYEIANKVGITMLGRALNRRHLLFSGGEYFVHGGGKEG